MTEKMTYANSGVNYDTMDFFKRVVQLEGQQTRKNIERINNGEFREVEMSRGESVFLIETPDSYLAHVEEGLGTKNLIADEMYQVSEWWSYYEYIAQDTVAMIVNDMITLGARPLSAAMHLAVGDSNWFNDKKRCFNLAAGWRNACNLAGCIWGNGETPTLKDIIAPETFVLSGSAIGIIKPKERLINPNSIQDGDAIILIESSGIHANGLTLARKVADNLPARYATMIEGNQTFGEKLLIPTLIYVKLVEECLNYGLKIHYAVNITGHGWRKLMRAKKPFAYIIERLPKQLLIFDFLQKMGPIDDYEAYATFNMGAGFALYVPESDADAILEVAASQKFGALNAGHIDKSDIRKVAIKPKNLEYCSETLGIR